jgi:hypothetical protein
VVKWLTLVLAFSVSVSSRAQQATTSQRHTPDAGAGTAESSPSEDSDAGQNTGGLDKSFAANQVLGRIQSLGSRHETVTLDVGGTDQRYQLGSQTTVFVEGRLGSAQDLKEGQQVRAAFEAQDGTKTIRWIEVTPAIASIQPPDTQPGVHAPSGGTGTVTSVLGNGKQLVIRYGTLTTSLLVNETTVVTRGSTVASARDIQPGMQVRTILDPTRTTATKVEILPQP